MSGSDDMLGSDKDSEFDSEEEDLEFHLYQQLYFEPNPDIPEAESKSGSPTPRQHDGKVSESCYKQAEQLDGCQMPDREILQSSHSLSTNTSKINDDQNPELDRCIYVDTLEGAELTLADFSPKQSTEDNQNHAITQQAEMDVNTGSEDSFSVDAPLATRNTASLQAVRERLSSTCSDGSIPGSVPLDGLYCNSVTSNEEEDDIINNRLLMKNVETNIEERKKEKVKGRSKKRKKRETSCSDDEPEESRCNNLLNAASKTPQSDTDVQVLEEDSNSDDIHVLPPPRRRNPEIVTLVSSSDSEVEAESRGGSCVKTNNNKYRKIETSRLSPLATRNKDGRSKGVHEITGNEGEQNRKEGCDVGAESESDSNDVDMPEATEGTDLTLNIDKNLSGWVKTLTKSPATTKKKKNITKKPHLGSSVDFSKGRPNTRKPSCEKWTQSMANFYDSDVSDDFDVSEIHHQQSDSPADWHLSAADYQISQRRRYFNAPERCRLCRQEGHTSNNCPRVPVCHLCSKTDHSSRSECPENCCFKCGAEPHFFCPITDLSRTCSLCGHQGHHKTLCPDLWRRFHLTTSGLTVQAPTKHTTRPSREQYCCSCGKQGHYGHDCPTRFQRRYYAQVSQSVVSYACPVKLHDGYFVVNTDGAQAPPLDESVTTMCIKSEDTGRIIGKKGAVVKEIIKKSGAHVRIIQEGQPQVLLFGPPEARLEAQQIIETLLGKQNGKYVGFVEHLLSSNNVNTNSSMPMSSNSDNTPVASSDSNNVVMAAGNSELDSWYNQFLSNLDRRKGHVLKQVKEFIKSLCLKKKENVSNSVTKLKAFRLKQGKVLSLEPTKAVKRHLGRIAMKVVGRHKYGNGHEIHREITTLLKQVLSCRSSIVPENLCVKIARTMETIHEPSIEKLDELIGYGERYTHNVLRKRALQRRKANKLNEGLNNKTIPNGNKDCDVIPQKNKKKINIKLKKRAMKRRKAKKARNQDANKSNSANGIKKKTNAGKKKQRKDNGTARGKQYN